MFETLIGNLHLVAKDPLVYVAFVLLTGAWLLRAYFTRTKNFLDAQKALPPMDQLSGFQLLILGHPATLTKNQLTLLQHKYRLVAYVGTLVALVVLAGLVVHYMVSPAKSAEQINERLTTISDTTADSSRQLSILTQKVTDVAAATELLTEQVEKYRAVAQRASEPPAPSQDLLDQNRALELKTIALESELSTYKTRFGPIDQSGAASVIAAADKAVRSAKATGDLFTLVSSQIALRHLTKRTHSAVLTLLGGKDLDDSMVVNWARTIRASQPETMMWHFIDIPIDAKRTDMPMYCGPRSCLLASLDAEVDTLKSPKTDRKTARIALLFLVGLIVDAHRPLHCADRNDRGGNVLLVSSPSHLHSNLHKIWDVDLLAEKIGERSPEEYADALDGEITSRQAIGWRAGTPRDWIWESHEVAVRSVYKDIRTNQSPVALSEDYWSTSGPVVDSQLMKAGVRLSSVLNGIFDGG